MGRRGMRPRRAPGAGLACAAVALVACAPPRPWGPVPGLGDAGPGEPPRLEFHVEGYPPYLSGSETLVAVATPEDAFFGVEFLLGEVAVGTVLQPPYRAQVDTTPLPDGPVLVTVTGMPRDTRLEPVMVTRDLRVGNLAPVLVVEEPVEGAPVVGSPAVGFRFRAKVQARDGNGLAGVTVSQPQGPTYQVDLGGTVLLPLHGVGDTFPVAPVPLTFRAVDTLERETVQVVNVVPTPVGFTFRGEPGAGGNRVEDMPLVPDGRVVVRTSVGRLWALNGPYDDDAVTLCPATRSAWGPLVLAPTGGAPAVFFTSSSSSGYRWQRATLDGQVGDLEVVDTGQGRAPAWGPVALSSGMVAWASNAQAPVAARLAAYTASGALAVDRTYQGVALGSEVAEGPGGSLLVITQGPPACARQVEMPQGTLGPCWPAPGLHEPSRFLLVSGDHVLVAGGYAQSGGPPLPLLALYQARTETLAWSTILSRYESPMTAWTTLAGEIQVWVPTNQPGSPSSVYAARATGLEGRYLFDGQDQVHTLVARLPQSGDLVVLAWDVVGQAGRLVSVNLEAATLWEWPVPSGERWDRADLLADGSLSVVTAPVTGLGDGTWRVLEVGRGLRWEERLPGLGMAGPAVDHAGGLAITWEEASGTVTVVEVRDLANGALHWRYRVPDTAPGSLGPAPLYDTTWERWVVPVSRVAGAGGDQPTQAAQVWGFLP